MPKAAKSINDVYATVTRPVAFSALKNIARLCGWDLGKEEVIFRGKAIQPQVLADLEFPMNSVDNEVKGPGDGFISVELQEQPEENAAIYDTVFKRNAMPIFADPKLGVSLVPCYATMIATLSITKRFVDLPSAERWWYDMKRLITQEHNAAFLEADYSYILPVQMLMVLKEIHRRREAVAGYGDSFAEYIRNGFDERASTETTVAGEGESKSVRLVIREHQMEISGFFDFADAPKPEKVEGTGAFDISFSYRYNYEAPTHVVARYPIQVHQQVLPSEYLNKPTYGTRDVRQVRRGGLAVQYQDRMRDQFLPKVNRYETVFKYPEIDEWTPSLRSDTELPATTLFTALFSVDPEQPNWLVGFEELAEVGEFHQELQRWFRDYPVWMKTYYQSPLYLEIWKNNVPYSKSAWDVDDHGNIVSVSPMDLRSTYRIRLALVNDLSLVQNQSLVALCEYPTLVAEILKALGLSSCLIPKPGPGGRINIWDLLEAIRLLPKTADWFRRRKDIIIPQVMIGTIIGVKRYGVEQAT